MLDITVSGSQKQEDREETKGSIEETEALGAKTLISTKAKGSQACLHAPCHRQTPPSPPPSSLPWPPPQEQRRQLPPPREQLLLLPVLLHLGQVSASRIAS